MTVAEALRFIRRVGEVENSDGILKVRFPERERAVMRPAIEVLRSGKAEALAILADLAKEKNLGPDGSQNLADVLWALAVELWSDHAGRLFIVADEVESNRLMANGVKRGEIYTAAEASQVVKIGDPLIVAEIHQWKWRFDGVIRETNKG